MAQAGLIPTPLRLAGIPAAVTPRVAVGDALLLGTGITRAEYGRLHPHLVDLPAPRRSPARLHLARRPRPHRLKRRPSWRPGRVQSPSRDGVPPMPRSPSSSSSTTWTAAPPTSPPTASPWMASPTRSTCPRRTRPGCATRLPPTSPPVGGGPRPRRRRPKPGWPPRTAPQRPQQRDPRVVGSTPAGAATALPPRQRPHPHDGVRGLPGRPLTDAAPSPSQDAAETTPLHCGRCVRPRNRPRPIAPHWIAPCGAAGRRTDGAPTSRSNSVRQRLDGRPVPLPATNLSFPTRSATR